MQFVRLLRAKIRQRRGARVIHMLYVFLNCPLPVHVNKYAPRAAPLCGMRKTVSLSYYINVVLAGGDGERFFAGVASLRPSQCATSGSLRICMSWPHNVRILSHSSNPHKRKFYGSAKE
jgi:hypothetical protein